MDLGSGGELWLSAAKSRALVVAGGRAFLVLLSPGVLEVEYQARQLTALGIPPGRRIAGEALGVLRLDLESGREERRAGGRLPRPDLAVPPPAGARARFQRIHVRPADATIVLGGPPPDVDAVLIAGDLRLVDVHSLASGERLATLQRTVDIAVVGGRVLGTTLSGNEELRLVATQPGTGRTAWTRTVWRAPPPSGPPVP